MEDFQLDIVLGKGPAARSIRLDLPRFTLVGATTRTGLITGPLRDRFGLVARLDYYDAADLEAIVVRAAGILGVDIDRRRAPPRSPAGPGARPASPTGCCAGSATSPRCGATARIDEATAHDGLAVFGVDELGLDKVDRAVLTRLCQRFGGGPVGLSHARHQRGRGRGDGRGRVRAVPHPAGPAHAHAARPGRHARGLGPPRAHRPAERTARRGPRPVVVRPLTG